MNNVEDMMVVNGWYLDGIPGLQYPNFETLDGIEINSENVETVDGVTNKKKRFSDQIVDFGTGTLTRPFQSNVDDYALQIFSIACIRQGYKVDVTATKRHKQVNVFSLLLKDFRIGSIKLPTFNVEGKEKFVVNYPFTYDDVYMIPLRFEVTNTPTLGTPAIGSNI